MYRNLKIAILFTMIPLVCTATSSNGELDMLRIRYVNDITGAGLDYSLREVRSWLQKQESEAQECIGKMGDGVSGSTIFTDIRLPLKGQENVDGSKNINTVFSRLRSIALVLKMEVSRFYALRPENKALLDRTLLLLDYMHEHYYNTHTFGIYYEDLDHNGRIEHFVWVDLNNDGIEQADEREVRRCNWWHMEIGIPRDFNDLVALLYDDIPEKKRLQYLQSIDCFIPNPYATTGGAQGANGIWAARNVALAAILAGNPTPRDANTPRYPFTTDKLTVAREKAESLVRIFPLEAGLPGPYQEGFYEDGSCISHARNSYTGGYGIGILSDNIMMIRLLAGSSYAISPGKTDVVYRWVMDGFVPLIAYGNMMDYTRGREVARTYQGNDVGRSVFVSICQLIPLVDEGSKYRLKAYLKQQLSYICKEIGPDSYLENVHPREAAQLREVYHDPQVTAIDEPEICRHYPIMNRFVCHSRHFVAGVAAHSSRIYNYEGLNTENNKGWHSSDGMFYLYNRDHNQYNDCFWPTYDAHYPAGTTVEEMSEMESGNKTGRNAWCGGSVAGSDGCFGMILQPGEPATLSAHKSWFFTGGMIICTGSGISQPGSDKNIFTVVENRKITGNYSFHINGKKVKLNPFSLAGQKVSWAHLSGSTAGTGIAYVFPSVASLYVKYETRKGSWRDINRYSLFIDSARYERNYLSMMYNHGADPQNGTYTYIILPGYSIKETGRFLKQNPVAIKDNSYSVHYVACDSVRMANFWEAAATSDGMLVSGGPASIIWKEIPGHYMLVVSDPTQLLDSLEISLALDVDVRTISHPRLLHAVKNDDRVILTFNTAGLYGEQIEIKCKNRLR